MTATLSFDQAIAMSTDLIQSVENQEIAAADAAGHLESIVSTTNGARGFFVALLTNDATISADLPAEFIDAFKKHSEVTCELLVKNLVMSACMAITHLRNQDQSMASKSRSVNEKTKAIIAKIDNDYMACKMQSMRASIESALNSKEDSASEYSSFLSRWKYDAEQLQECLGLFNAL